MSVSTKTRFEVFKRDRFTCAYCGRTPPEVLLHVDHIIPKVDGGPDDIENLVTACQDCNLGKGARPLASRPASGPTAAELEERIEQAKQYLALMSEVRDIRDQLVDLVIAYWAKAWDGDLVERDDGTYYEMPNGGYFPEAKTIKSLTRKLPLEAIYEAVDITSARFPYRASYDSTKYFYGVCWRMVRDREAT